MKIVVHGGSLGSGASRLRVALEGLALRGHDLRWHGGEAPAVEGIRISAPRGAHEPAELVVGAGAAFRVALLGRRAHARAMVLGLDEATLARWGVLDRLGWSALPAYGLLEERDAPAARAAGSHLAPERVVVWDARESSEELAASEHSAPPAPLTTRPDVELLERVAERALATRGGRAAVFVDRDGTLIVERGYLGDPAGVELLPGAAAGLRLLRDAGLPVVVISNQSGIARGKFTLAAAHATMARLRRLLREQGVELDSIRFCPHAPDAGCTCRKPGTRLLAEAAEDLRLSLAASAMVGDKRLDAETGRAVGGTGVLVRTGYGREEEARIADGAFVPPDAVVDDFAAAAAWIVARHESR